MTKAERTRQFIVEKTAPLFNTKGYDGTSLADLTEATGLTKGALYGNFADKDEIAEAAFHYSMKKVKALMKQEMESVKTYKQRLQALLSFFARYVNKPPVAGGCPLLNTAIEADDHRTSMRRVVTKELMATIDFIASQLEGGVKAGEFISTIKPRELAYVFFCSVEGALMFSRVERSNEPMEIVVKHCKKILDQISQ
ncbi:TetR/AcrR family transcriptional regulator [Fulvivirgaceae bacterium PWU4]|uniref:TetR/AcrR family transcriptional regulator n=1 Tax=Chryseosolibacter histidini TaxID=2782349 RepID=A0AAP2DHR2_9BACT|nr:TetR/AcrR family transcriptional regulator [Chryseosolibacter histidini]MBT1695824.1 TetR/AcrR family transcriptional regulator [Chryseosolibacter histidini]